MSGAARLALAHLRHHPLRSALLALCVLIATLLPLATRALSGNFQYRLLARARSTPLLAGAKGSRFDIIMAGLYFRPVDCGTLTMKDWRELADTGLADAIPLNVRFTAGGHPLIATSSDYFDARGLSPATGTRPIHIGEVAIGATLARRTRLIPGSTIFSDQRDLFDISRPPSLKLHIVGILAPSGTPDDDALFCDLKTAWVLEGAAHAHADAAKAVPDQLILDKSSSQVVISEELVDYNELNANTVDSFHIHGDPLALPISCILLLPHSEKDASILKARTNAGNAAQVLIPADAVHEMLGYVARIRQLLDALAIIILSLTLLLIGLVTALSVRVRTREIETLSRIGASCGTIFAIFAWEVGLLFTAGLFLAAALTFLVLAFPPDLVKFL